MSPKRGEKEGKMKKVFFVLLSLCLLAPAPYPLDMEDGDVPK